MLSANMYNGYPQSEIGEELSCCSKCEKVRMRHALEQCDQYLKLHPDRKKENTRCDGVTANHETSIHARRNEST